MRISPVRSYNYQPQIQSDNNKNIAFKSSYDDLVEEIAKKYQYVKYPSELIYKEFNKHYFWWNINDSMLQDVKVRIEKLNSARKLRDARISNMNTTIKKADSEISAEKEIHNQLTNKISETQLENASERIKMSRIVASYSRVAEVKTQLEDKYVNLFKFDGDKKFPNAIMISGLKNEEEKEQILDFLSKNNCKMIKTDFANVPLKAVVKEINGFANKIKKSGEHSLLYINNFDKYTLPTKENMDFISKFKGFLCSCSKRCDTTVLVFENNPKRLDENIIGGHRFEKKIDVSNVKEEISSVFVPKYDGYTFVYDTDVASQLDLYLGDLGKNPAILWANTTSYDKVKVVLDRLDEIRAMDKFKYVKSLQVPYSPRIVQGGFTICPCKRTHNGSLILERKI